MNVSCQAESYRGSFHCSWMGPRSAVFRARLRRRWVPQSPLRPPWPREHPALTPASPHSDGSLGQWVPAAGRRGRFSASLADPSFCPFAEELRPMELQLEGLSDTSYLNFSFHFFIRDIGELSPAAPGPRVGSGALGAVWEGLVPGLGSAARADPAAPAVRPDPPQELTVQQRGEQLHLTWAPPASWPLPKSYFALLYWLQYELRNGTQVTAGCPCPAHAVPRPRSAAPTLPQPGLFPLPRGATGNRHSAGAQQWPPPHSTAAPLGVVRGHSGCHLCSPAPALTTLGSVTA